MLIQGGVLGVSVGSRCSRIGGGLRGDSLFSADGAAAEMRRRRRCRVVVVVDCG